MPPFMHACMHACMHAYIHAPVPRAGPVESIDQALTLCLRPTMLHKHRTPNCRCTDRLRQGELNHMLWYISRYFLLLYACATYLQPDPATLLSGTLSLMEASSIFDVAAGISLNAARQREVSSYNPFKGPQASASVAPSTSRAITVSHTPKASSLAGPDIKTPGVGSLVKQTQAQALSPLSLKP